MEISRCPHTGLLYVNEVGLSLCDINDLEKTANLFTAMNLTTAIIIKSACGDFILTLTPAQIFEVYAAAVKIGLNTLALRSDFN